jgi:hypothetical protein
MLSAPIFVQWYIDTIMAICIFTLLSGRDLHGASLSILSQKMRVFVSKFTSTAAIGVAILTMTRHKHQDAAHQYIKRTAPCRKFNPKGVGGDRAGTRVLRMAEGQLPRDKYVTPALVQVPTGGYNCAVM